MSETADGEIVCPKVFISYTHESPTHKAWVAALATDLRSNGIDIILDQWDLTYGADVTLFMEAGIRTSSRVLLVCTPTYARKADSGSGGVGYERLVVTGEMAEKIDTNKFVCIIRSGEKSTSLPTFAKTRLYSDFREDANYDLGLEELLRDLHQAPKNPKPPLGANPFALNTQNIPVATRSQPQLIDVFSSGSTEEIYARAITLLRQRDLVGWKHLVREVHRAYPVVLKSWREEFEHKIRSNAEIIPAVEKALSAVSKPMLLALCAVDSEIDQIRDQIGFLDDLTAIPNWSYAGQTIIAEVPKALALIFHHLLGALLIANKRHSDAIGLLQTSISSAHDRVTKPLWETHDLMGWTPSLHGDCATSWSFLLSLYGKLPWLSHFFTSVTTYQRSLRSYILLASLLELLQRISMGSEQSLTASFGALDVPPMFALPTDEDQTRLGKILGIAVPNHEVTKLIASQKNVSVDEFRTQFKQWSGQWARWHINGGRHFYSGDGNLELP